MTQLGSPATESGPSHSGQQPVRGSRLARRRRVLLGVGIGAALLGVGGVIGAAFVKSPQQLAADTAPPAPTVTRTFSPFSRAASSLDGRMFTGMNASAPELPELAELAELLELADPLSAADPAEPAEDEALPMSTTVPVGTVVVGVPSSDTFPVARMPVSSSKIVAFRPALTWAA